MDIIVIGILEFLAGAFLACLLTAVYYENKIDADSTEETDVEDDKMQEYREDTLAYHMVYLEQRLDNRLNDMLDRIEKLETDTRYVFTENEIRQIIIEETARSTMPDWMR